MSFYIEQWWPWILLLLAPWIILVWRHSLAGLPPWRQSFVLAIRLVLLILLIMTLSNVQIVRDSKLLTVAFVLDKSKSIPQSLQDHGIKFVGSNLEKMDAENDRASLWVFGQEPRAEFQDQGKGILFRIDTKLEDIEHQTNISKALKLALACLPEAGERRIVLLSDGNETMGNCEAEIAFAQERKIPIDVFPLAIAKGQEQDLILEKLLVPNEVNEGQAYQAIAVVHSLEQSSAIIRLIIDNQLLYEKVIEVKPGKNQIVLTIPATLVKKGFQQIKAIIEGPKDKLIANNIAQAFCYVQGIPQILYLEKDLQHAHFLQDALAELQKSGQSRINVEVKGPYEFPRDILSLNTYDLVILSNISCPTLDTGQMKMLETAVKDDGLGFIMIGGEDSFGAGGYANTPVEKILPVDMDLKHKKSHSQWCLSVSIAYVRISRWQCMGKKKFPCVH